MLGRREPLAAACVEQHVRALDRETDEQAEHAAQALATGGKLGDGANERAFAVFFQGRVGVGVVAGAIGVVMVNAVVPGLPQAR